MPDAIEIQVNKLFQAVKSLQAECLSVGTLHLKPRSRQIEQIWQEFDRLNLALLDRMFEKESEVSKQARLEMEGFMKEREAKGKVGMKRKQVSKRHSRGRLAKLPQEAIDIANLLD